MPTSQPLRTYAFLTRLAGAQSLVAGKCTTTATCNKKALNTSTKLPQAIRITNEELGKRACCANHSAACKGSLTAFLGRTPGCGCCRSCNPVA